MSTLPVGHYNTWLIDSLQRLVEKNHGVVLYPTWSNASDFEPTQETFGTVPLASPELVAAMKAHIKVDEKTVQALSAEQRYIMQVCVRVCECVCACGCVCVCVCVCVRACD